MERLLTTRNMKLEKGKKFGYLSAILHLAPSDLSGRNVCPMATTGCRAACLNTAGQGGMIKGSAGLSGSDLVAAIKAGSLTNHVQTARIRKTNNYFDNRPEFMAQLVKEVAAHIRRAIKNNLIPCVRLNGTSDIRWETVEVDGKRNIMEVFPDVQFYDYTKIANRRNLPANYHLTFSLAEDNDYDARRAMGNGMNVAVVFRNRPVVFMAHKVIDGDISDLRFLDKSVVIVGLSAKAKAKKDTSGFVR